MYIVQVIIVGIVYCFIVIHILYSSLTVPEKETSV